MLQLALAACGGGSAGTTDATSGGTSTGAPGTATGTSGEPDPTSTSTAEATSTSTGETTNDPGTSTFCGLVHDPDVLTLRRGARCNDCGEAQVALQRTLPLVLVVDKSGSTVSETWDADGDPNTPEVTRWSSIHAAVAQFAADHQDIFALGLVLSPGTGATEPYTAAACQVAAAPDVAISPLEADALIAALPPADAGPAQVAGATPHRAALQLAYEHLEKDAPDGRGHVVLLTDGAANCSPQAVDDATRFEAYDAAIEAVAATARAAGITTLVLGLEVEDATSLVLVDGEPDATNNHARLGQLAVAGGGADATYWNSHDQASLAAALAAVVERAYPCVLPLDPVPKYPDHVLVTLGDMDLPQLQGPCGDEAGWYYTTVEKNEIALCGALCAAFRDTGTIDLQYRCPGGDAHAQAGE